MQSSKHIVVIDPGTSTPELDCYNKIVSLSEIPCTYHLPALYGSESLNHETIENIEAIIVLGGSGDLNEELDWRIELEAWFKKCLDRKIPTLGICWGHQWIAKIFGGKIGLIPDMNSEKQTGQRKISLQPCTLSEVEISGKVVVSHRYMVTDAPQNVKEIVKSELLFNEAFEYLKYPIFTFQSHPEATEMFMLNNSIAMTGSEDYKFGHTLVELFLRYARNSSKI